MSWIQSYKLLQLSISHHSITKIKFQHWWQKKMGLSLNFPSLVRFFLFYGCNLRCFMCGQWGETGVAKTEEVKNFLPIEKLKFLIDEIAKHKSEIYIWGGEPTLHPNFVEFISHLKSKKLTCTINTNGVLLEKYAEDIVKNKIDSLDLSLIGPEDIHNQSVGVPNTFKQVMNGLKKIEEKSLFYNYKPLIKAIITLNSLNIKEIENLLKEIENNPIIDLSIIQLGWFTTSKVGEIYEKRMQKSFDLAAKSWSGFLNSYEKNFALSVQNLIQKIRVNKEYKKPILFFPNIKTKDVANYYLDHSNSFGYKKCGALEREIDIRHNGDVVICADFPDYVIGNLNEESIKKIWQGEKLKEFHEDIKKNGLFSICNRCCGLFR